MAGKKRIEIIATDGRRKRGIMWIEQAADGSFYWGSSIKGINVHNTYHASGVRRIYPHGEVWMAPRLTEFKGNIQLSYMGAIKDLTRTPYKKYESRKIDGVVYVDFRTLRRQDFHVSLHLIEEDHPEHLQKLLKVFPNPQAIHLFTFTNPWTAIIIR